MLKPRVQISIYTFPEKQNSTDTCTVARFSICTLHVENFRQILSILSYLLEIEPLEFTKFNMPISTK